MAYIFSLPLYMYVCGNEKKTLEFIIRKMGL